MPCKELCSTQRKRTKKNIQASKSIQQDTAEKAISRIHHLRFIQFTPAVEMTLVGREIPGSYCPVTLGITFPPHGPPVANTLILQSVQQQHL